MLIEFDGKQHFEPSDLFGGEAGFKIRKINDNIKDTFCATENIKLLRIPYFDMNKIEEILSDEFISCGIQ